MIQCVKNAACDDNLSYTNNQSIIDIADKHDLAHLLCERKSIDAMYRYTRQEEATRELRTCLNNAKVEFIFLKGTVIRKYYPEPWMRTCADIDILVHPQDLKKARNVIIQEMGYQYYPAGTHHDLLQSADKIISIELHFLLLEDNRIEAASDVLKYVWEYTCDVDNTSEKKLKPEMLYYYHIAHMAKHFQKGGCGIRYFLDLWILRHQTDFYISKCENFVREHGLEKFEREAVALSEKWFSCLDVEINEVFAEMVLVGGLYGTPATKIEINSAKHRNKFSTYISRIFMNPSLMKIRYPAVNKCIILLPLFWIVRWIQVFTQGDVELVKKEIEIIDSLDNGYRKSIKNLFDSLGLN